MIKCSAVNLLNHQTFRFWQAAFLQNTNTAKGFEFHRMEGQIATWLFQHFMSVCSYVPSRHVPSVLPITLLISAVISQNLKVALYVFRVKNSMYTGSSLDPWGIWGKAKLSHAHYLFMLAEAKLRILKLIFVCHHVPSISCVHKHA